MYQIKESKYLQCTVNFRISVKVGGISFLVPVHNCFHHQSNTLDTQCLHLLTGVVGYQPLRKRWAEGLHPEHEIPDGHA